MPPPCSEGDIGQQPSAHLSHLAPGLPSGPLAPPSSFPELLALTFGAVLACVSHFAGTAVGPVAGQAVAAAPTGAREAGVTHCLTVVAKEALWTHAQVGPTTVLTPASVLAGAGGTGIHLWRTPKGLARAAGRDSGGGRRGQREEGIGGGKEQWPGEGCGTPVGRRGSQGPPPPHPVSFLPQGHHSLGGLSLGGLSSKRMVWLPL